MAPDAGVVAVRGGPQRHDVVEGQRQPGARHLREERGQRRDVRDAGERRAQERRGGEEGLHGACYGEQGLDGCEEEAVGRGDW